MSTITVFSPPRSRAEWCALALRLAELPPEQMPAGDRAAFQQLRNTAWDVASGAAYWQTVQLPSLGPGLLPLTVIALLTINMAAGGQLTGSWPDFSSPFLLWPCLWLMGWWGGTAILAAIRHRRAQGRALALGAQLHLFSPSA